jgi:hypothetical protein
MGTYTSFDPHIWEFDVMLAFAAFLVAVICAGFLDD